MDANALTVGLRRELVAVYAGVTEQERTQEAEERAAWRSAVQQRRRIKQRQERIELEHWRHQQQDVTCTSSHSRGPHVSAAVDTEEEGRDEGTHVGTVAEAEASSGWSEVERLELTLHGAHVCQGSRHSRPAWSRTRCA